jgi:hypothetical protein
MNAQHADIKIAEPELPFNVVTDLALPTEWSQRVNAARRTMPALDDLFTMIETRTIKTQDGKEIPLPSYAVTLEQAELFYYLVTEMKPILSIETGFNMGLTASVITLAHMVNGLNGGHIPIQEQAKQVEHGVGFYTMERLGLTGYQIMEHEPALVLPQVYLQKLNDGLKFVLFSSSDDFEEQMMEYFYINRLLNEGGVMAINLASPARRQLLDYIRQNRHDYAIRELDCNIALVQKPSISDLAKYTGVKH